MQPISQSTPRLVALHALKRAITALDDERLLDQRALDRVLASTLGTLKRECNRALAAREPRQLSLDSRRAA